MNFILVNGRTPFRTSLCAFCGKSIGDSYLRDMGTLLCYCDQTCHADHCNRVMHLPGRTRAVLPSLASNHAKKKSESELTHNTQS
jgi:hypothetical protein